MQFITFSVIWKRIKAIRFMMKDKSVPLRKKALVVFGVVYLFLPFNLIPPLFFTFGWIGDVILWLYILFTLRETLDRYWVGEKEVPPSKKYRGKNVIYDVKFDVREEDETDAKKEETSKSESDRKE